MPTTLDILKHAFTRAIRGQLPDLAVDIYDADVPVVPTTNPAFGDYQCNAAMALAKRAKLKPRDVATALVSAIGDLDGLAEKVEIAGPGFINITLSPAWIEARLAALSADSRLGVPAAAAQTVIVDYSGPNVAKQMHVGHLRSTIIGDAIARVMAFLGHNVIRQNHIGDWGTQFGMLISFLRESASTGGSLRIEDLDGFYKEARKRFDADNNFADTARATVVSLQAGEPNAKNLWQTIVAESRRHFEPIYATLGVQLTSADERGESFYNSMLPGNVADLRAAGVAEQSDGATVAFTPGVEAPLILEKTGGGYGYATTDLAAIRYRVGTLGAKRIIYFVGVPQSQHFKQVFDVARRSGWAGDAVLEHAAFGSVLGTDGKMFKARSGDSVKLADLLAEAEQRALTVVSSKSPELLDAEKQKIAHAVGIGAVKYADLSKDRLGDYVFDFDTMLAMDGNTAPYLQYAHARIRSIFRKAELSTPNTSHNAAITVAAQQELTLAKHLLRLGEVIEDVARDLKPHVLCQYLYDLATKFSGFYEHCPVLKSEEPTRSSRLALCDLTARTLALGLDLLGIEHPEQM